MKRETMEWLKDLSDHRVTEVRRVMALDVLAELKRLRRIERAANAWMKSMGNYDDYARAERALIAALKKGGRK